MKSIQYVSGGVSAQIGVFTEVLDYDPRRKFFQVQNKGDDSIFVFFGDPLDATELASIEVGSGELFEPFTAPTNKVSISTSAAGATESPVFYATDSITTVA